MFYPAAPWQLQGYGLQTLHLIDIDRVRAQIPAELAIVPFFPGKTIGGVYIASYGSGSVLEYNELIVVSAVVYRIGNQEGNLKDNYAGKHLEKLGVWISHIYVDNPYSVAGGREIWGLPKELAEFTWSQGCSQVQVRQGDRLLCKAERKARFPGIPFPVQLSVFSTIDSQLIKFKGTGKVNGNLATVSLQVPPVSPFSYLDLNTGHLGFDFNSLLLNAGVPSTITH